MATQKFSELTTTTTPNSASIFAIAYSGTSYGVTLANIAANLPATTVTSLTSSGNITVTGDLTISGDDLFMNTNTSGAALIADGTNFNPVVISGDIAIAAGGAATIQATSVESGMLNNNVISGQTEITSGLADADELLYSDAGVLKKVGMDTAKSYFHSSTATAITVADESSDTTCFPIFVTAATGDLAPKSGTNLAFNSSSGLLTATGFSGPLTGNVTGDASGSSGSCTGNSATATSAATLTTARNIGGVSFNGSANIDLPGVNSAGNQNTSGTAAIATTVTVADESSDTTCFPLFATAATGDLAPKSGSNLSFNSATGALTATSFVGTAPTATVITVADESSDTTCFPLFVTAATGDLGPKSAAGLTFNSSSDTLTATAFSGPLTGNVTGNASGSSGSCTGLAATATALASARNIGGVSFDGTGNIDLPGVNAAGNQATSGLAATATILATARDIGGVSFNGSASINLPGVNTAGNQNTSGTAAGITAGTTVTDIVLRDIGFTTNAIGSIGGGAQTIDLSLGNSVSGTVDTGTTTFTFSNPTASDELCMFSLVLTNGGSQTVNFPSSVDWEGGTAPTLTAAGVDLLVFATIDGGTIWHGQVMSLDSKSPS